MRIIIDLQGAQTESRFRGIGRYSLSLAQAIARNAKNHDILLILNANFPESILTIREAFKELIPNENIHIFDVPSRIAEQYDNNEWRIQAAEKIRSAFIQNLKPDFLLVTSLFEGYIDDACISIEPYQNNYTTGVILYDLIPFLNPSLYLSNSSQKKYYLRKIEFLKKASLLLAISEYSKQSATEALHISANNIVNISTAVEPVFAPKQLNPDEIEHLQQKYKLSRKIILCVPGGFDARKNLNNLIRAYSLLSPDLKSDYQLVISSKISNKDLIHFKKIGESLGLRHDELIITDYIPNDELVNLYNLAELFVFPSLCEGFGLPLLEAMACGAPVIGSNNSSIPEVIGFIDALFDASNAQSIADKLSQALNDQTFLFNLKQHSLIQAKKFSWDTTAKLTLDSIEQSTHKKTSRPTPIVQPFKKYKLAFIAPLPPERTGIADYSADLLNGLIEHYDIDLITDQTKISLNSTLSKLTQRTVAQFRQSSHTYDRIIYQMGNSPYHTHMLQLMCEHPGVLVLHDFYLSSLLAYEQQSGNIPGIWTQALYDSHGYSALETYYKTHIEKGYDYTKNLYPCNLKVLQSARGIISHSRYAKHLTHQWYGNSKLTSWEIIPLVRSPAHQPNKISARKALGIDTDTFIICSFGMVDSSKLNHLLLEAWLASPLSANKKYHLIFVGENHGGDYGLNLLNTIKKSNAHNNIKITGWCDQATYQHYLEAADLGVQLRSHSRGETSAAALDCMNYGLATIINANGSMSELPENAVYLLPDLFTQAQLTSALEDLSKNHEKRLTMGNLAKIHIETQHSPSYCATQYKYAIEDFYHPTNSDLTQTIESIANLDTHHASDDDLTSVAKSISKSILARPRQKQLLIDVTNIRRQDRKSGIERVIRSQLLELIKNPPKNYRIEPIFLNVENETPYYCYARDYTCHLLGITPTIHLANDSIEVCSQDLFYALDYAPYDIVRAGNAGIFTSWQALDIKMSFLVYDLLPILKPHFFPKNSDDIHNAWLNEVKKYASNIVCISSSVKNELNTWLEHNPPSDFRSIKLHAAPLGADIIASAPTLGLPNSKNNVAEQIKNHISFLMVGTIEPRKGHLQTIAAFEELWAQGYSVTLVIVGNEGWKGLEDNERRTIPSIIKKLNHHPALNKQLFWLSHVSDEYLHQIYHAATCFIAPSEGEGFGLPLIEASKFTLPIIARDLPVFKEIAQEHAYYFSGTDPQNLSCVIKNWLSLHENGHAPDSSKIVCNTWERNVGILKSILCQEEQDLLCTNKNEYTPKEKEPL